VAQIRVPAISPDNGIVRRLIPSDASKEFPADAWYLSMKTQPIVLGCFIAATLFTTVSALTMDQPVTPADVREHPRKWSVLVTQGKDGLTAFTIKHDVASAMYHVAHLEIRHQGKLIATSDTPSFGRMHGNTFHFSLSAEDVGKSRFSLSDCALSGTGDDAVPIVGTTVHQFRLTDFVPEQMLKSALGE
jgi:hypothetical protein